MERIVVYFFRRVERKLDEISGKRFIHLIHVGKTGGTAIKFALKPYYRHGRFVIYPHSHSFTLKDAPVGEGIIFFLRDPITRYVSGFYSRQREGRPRLYSPWTPDEKVVFERFTTPNQLAESLSSSVTSEQEFAKFAMNSIKHVRNHYWYWFGDEEYFSSRQSDIFFIGFQETLDHDFEILKRKLKLPAKTVLPTNAIVAHRNPESLDRKLSDQAVKNLRDWYSQDYEFIEKCKKTIIDANLHGV